MFQFTVFSEGMILSGPSSVGKNHQFSPPWTGPRFCLLLYNLVKTSFLNSSSRHLTYKYMQIIQGVSGSQRKVNRRPRLPHYCSFVVFILVYLLFQYFAYLLLIKLLLFPSVWFSVPRTHLRSKEEAGLYPLLFYYSQLLNCWPPQVPFLLFFPRLPRASFIKSSPPLR